MPRGRSRGLKLVFYTITSLINRKELLCATPTCYGRSVYVKCNLVEVFAYIFTRNETSSRSNMYLLPQNQVIRKYTNKLAIKANQVFYNVVEVNFKSLLRILRYCVSGSLGGRAERHGGSLASSFTIGNHHMASSITNVFLNTSQHWKRHVVRIYECNYSGRKWARLPTRVGLGLSEKALWIQCALSINVITPPVMQHDVQWYGVQSHLTTTNYKHASDHAYSQYHLRHGSNHSLRNLSV